MKKIRTLIIGLSLIFLGSLSFSPAAHAFTPPATTTPTTTATTGTGTTTGGCNATTVSDALKCGTGNGIPGSNSDPGTTLSQTIADGLNVLSAAVAVISIIMIIIGAIRFVGAAGNDTAIKHARDTIMYALVGLVIVVLAQIIVQFVLAKLNKAQTSGSTSTTTSQTNTGTSGTGNTNTPGNQAP